MTVELTLHEAELLIAILTGAEGAFAVVQPELVEALKDLRAWRRALLTAYLREARAGFEARDVPGMETQA